MANIIVIAHGDMADIMVKTAFSILGSADGVQTMSITDTSSAKDVEQELLSYIKEHEDEDNVILTDMFGGTASNIAISTCRDFLNCYIVCGFNLSMTLSAINYRKKLSGRQLAEKLIQDGKRAVLSVNELV